jgi:hypothetical protein
MSGAPGLDPAPPDPATWARLPDDLFGEVVAHARRALVTLDAVHTSPEVTRLRAIPAAKLRRGGGRRRLLAVLARGGPVWLAVRTRIEQDVDLVARLVAALAPSDEEASSRAADEARGRLAAAEQAVDEARAQRDEARRQRDQARAERDEARTQRDGAAGREAGLRARIESLEATVTSLRDEVGRLEAEVATGEETKAQAVARERRRAAGERADLARELTEARRELDDARRAEARRARQQAADRSARASADLAGAAATGSVPGASPPPARAPDEVVPGRPSRLPVGLRLDTREGVERLLAPGRRLLVDGYNVTRTQRPELSLEQQRRWLVNALEALAASRRLDVTVVFDAHVDGRSGGRPRRRGVTVQYSLDDMTADDELVFAVAAMEPDEPVVVVTDDRELRRRLAPHGVDLLHTTALAWLL